MGTINFLEEAYYARLKKDAVEKINISQLNELIEDVVSKIINEHSTIVSGIKNKVLKKNVLETKIVEILDTKNVSIPNISRKDLIKKIMDEIFGYSILQKYIEDPDVNDIMVNDYDCIYIRKNLTDIKISERFRDKNHYLQFLYKVCAFIGEKLNESSPQVDGNDDNYGLRINITISPINTYNPSLVIRKRHKHFPLEYILNQGNMSSDMYDTFNLMAKVNSRVIFAGQLESGKTTLLNSYLNLIDKRTVIMEDTPELFTTNSNTIYQKTVKGDGKESVKVTLADLVKNFRRTNALMPVVGEVRGEEAVELLDLFNTGFTCGASSIHANSVEDVVNQLIFQIKASGKLGVDREELEEYIGRTIDMIVYMEKRKVIEVTEIYYDKKLIFHPLHKFEIQEETANTLKGEFKNLNPYSKKMQDRIRRAGLINNIPTHMLK